jgi:hypothetical protein
MRFRLPEGATSISVGGVEYAPDSENCVQVPEHEEAACVRAGCMQVGNDQAQPEPESTTEPEADAAGGDADGKRKRGGRGGN